MHTTISMETQSTYLEKEQVMQDYDIVDYCGRQITRERAR